MIGKWFIQQFMRFHVFIYRRSGGKWLGQMGGMPLLLLTTIGRKSGAQHTTPLMFIRDGADYVITASNGGDDKNPGWFWNLKANPQTSIEVGDKHYSVTARQANPEEKVLLWAQLVARAPAFEGYKTKTTRDIPMMILQPNSPARAEEDRLTTEVAQKP